MLDSSSSHIRLATIRGSSRKALASALPAPWPMAKSSPRRRTSPLGAASSRTSRRASTERWMRAGPMTSALQRLRAMSTKATAVLLERPAQQWIRTGSLGTASTKRRILSKWAFRGPWMWALACVVSSKATRWTRFAPANSGSACAGSRMLTTFQYDAWLPRMLRHSDWPHTKRSRCRLSKNTFAISPKQASLPREC